MTRWRSACATGWSPATSSRAAHEFAAEIGRSAPLATAAIKTQLRRDMLDRLSSVLAAERESQEALMQTADFAEGISAYAERRVPTFFAR